jgi:hypothetical protein
LGSLISILIAEVMDSSIVGRLSVAVSVGVDIAEGRPRLLISNFLIRVAGLIELAHGVKGALYTHICVMSCVSLVML